MRTVTVRLPAAGFSVALAAMREWLDRNRYEPTKFNYDQDDEAVVLSVEFPNDQEAEAFAGCFDLGGSSLEEADDGHQDRPARLRELGKARGRRTLPCYNCFYLCDCFWDRPLKCFSDVPEPIRRTPVMPTGGSPDPFWDNRHLRSKHGRLLEPVPK